MFWWETIEPVETHIECGGNVHTVRWQDGRLTLDDHDVDAERTLSALGPQALGPQESAPGALAAVPECMELYHAWHGAFTLPALQTRLGERVDDRSIRNRYASAWDAYRNHVSSSSVRRALLHGGAADDPMHTSRRLAPGIELMPLELRWVLGIAVAAGAGVDDKPRAEVELHNRRYTAAVGVSAALMNAHRTSTRATPGHPHAGEVHTFWNPRPTDLRYMRAEADDFEPDHRTIFTVSETREIRCRFVPSVDDVEVSGRVVDGVVVAAAAVTDTWTSTVAARGLCQDHLVLSVTDTSSDHRRVEAIAGRWTHEPEGWTLHTQPAVLTETDALRWEIQWLDSS